MIINLSNKFYKKLPIEKAAEVLKDFGSFRILNDSFDIEIIPNSNLIFDLAGEFKNAVLSITQDEGLF